MMGCHREAFWGHMGDVGRKRLPLFLPISPFKIKNKQTKQTKTNTGTFYNQGQGMRKQYLSLCHLFTDLLASTFPPSPHLALTLPSPPCPPVLLLSLTNCAQLSHLTMSVPSAPSYPTPTCSEAPLLHTYPLKAEKTSLENTLSALDHLPENPPGL